MNNWEDGIQYAIDVTKGNIQVCKNVELSCQRFLDFMGDRHWEYEFHEKYVRHFLRFVDVLKHTKGPDAGTPVCLQPFRLCLSALFMALGIKKI